MTNDEAQARRVRAMTRISGIGSNVTRSFLIQQDHHGDKDGVRLLRTLREALMREFNVKVGDSPFNTTLGAAEWINAQPGDPAYEQVQSELQKDKERTSLAGRVSDLVDALAELEQSFEEREGDGFTLSIKARL